MSAFICLEESLSEYGATLDFWARWLFDNDQHNGPGRVIKPGETFTVQVADVVYHELAFDDGVLTGASAIDFTAAIVALTNEEGGSWSEDDLVDDVDDLVARVFETKDDSQTFVAVATFRPGEFTATYDIVDGTPVLQPDGWVL